MGFAISPPLQRTLDTVKTLMEREIYPLEKDFLTRPFAELERALAAVREKVRALGLLAPHMPVDVGGAGLHFLHFARLSEELGKSPFGLLAFNAQAPDAGNMELMHQHCTAEQRARFFEPVIAGKARSCFAMTEPEHAGSNPVIMSTSARIDGDDFVIDGHKWFTTAADGAAFAIVMAVTDPDAAPHARASMIFVPTDTPGFTRVRNISVMGETGHGPFSHAELRFDGCRVPRTNLLGAQGQGFKLAQDRLGPGRIHHCMRWIGVAERALALMIDRARTRQIGFDRHLADMQTVQTWIAESRAEIDAARLLVLNAAEAIEQRGARAARVEISCIKFFVPDVMLRVLDRAIQVHGSLGMTDDTILAWLYRHERASRIYDGPDEVHKQVVAKQLLRMDHA